MSRSEPKRRIVKASTVRSTIPSWAWKYNGRGRILKGGLTLFAGRPAAGKSTTARWFAAGWTQGTLPGCWEREPVNVAYLAAEESWSHVVVPSLQAAGADMDRVFFIQDGDKPIPARVKSIRDEAELAEMFREHEIRAVILDPLMSTLNGGADIYRSSEVREALDPWVRISEKIDGVVLGIAHLTKAAKDITAGINGSSAFGEVARCVFGLAPDHQAADESRVMTQSKNSSGIEGLNLAYQIGERTVTVTDGQQTDMAAFELIGVTRRDVRDILREDNTPAPKAAVDTAIEPVGGPSLNARETWLSDYLTANGEVLAPKVMADAEAVGFSKDQIKRASKDIGVVKTKTRDGWTWVMPPRKGAQGSSEGSGNRG